MVQAALRSILPSFVVTVLVTLASSWSWGAAASCAWVYGEKSIYTTSYQPLKDLVYENYALTEAIKDLQNDGGKGADQTTLQKSLRQIENLAEQYLAASGFLVRKVRTSYSFQSKDGDAIRLKYNRYILKGTLTGDEFVRLVYDVQKRETANSRPGQFILELLYELKNPDSGAQYFPAEHLVEIGPRSIERFVTGLGTELQHEIRHHLEERKIEAGEMSLARIEFTSGNEIKGDPYSVEFALDELITNLNDFKKISDQRRNAEIDSELTAQMTAEKLRFIQETRVKLGEDKRKIVETLFARVEMQMALLRKAVENGQYEIGDSGKVEVILNGGPYRVITINLTAMQVNKKEMTSKVLEVLVWTESQIQSLRRSLN